MRPCPPERLCNSLSRREFVVSIGGAILAPPVTAFAQPYSIPVIGLLDSAASTAAELADFYYGLKVEGYVANQTLIVEYRAAAGNYSRLAALAADFVKRQVSAIATVGIPAALAAKTATTKIAIIFAVGPDPVQSGLIGSLDQPGGSITGLTDLATGRERKRLALLHDLVPSAGEIALLVNPMNPNVDAQSRDAVAAARALEVPLKLISSSADDDFGTTFDALAASPPRGLVIADDELFDSRSTYLAFLAAHHRIPAIFQGRAFVAAGGLMSYGSSLTETYHQAGVYTGMILKGAVAAGLPVYQSTKIEFIVNARTAAFLGIVVPVAMLDAANEVIR